MNTEGDAATPMPLNISQQLFEQFCKENTIRCDHIPEDNERKTPDYQIFFGAKLVVAEVKQIDPNDRDRQEMQELKEGKTVTTWSEPGSRVRLKIRAGDNVSSGTIEPYDIMTGMYGLEVLRVAVARGSYEQPRTIDRGFGPKRTCTPEHNTSISAVALMFRGLERDLRLSLFHNVHARTKIDPEWIRLETVRHYAVEPDKRGKLQDCMEF